MSDKTHLNPTPSLNAPAAASPEPASFDAPYRVARRRVRMLRGWYVHALTYACVIAGLWTIYAVSGHQARFLWPLPPTFGWGLGLAIHGLVVWLGTSSKGRQWESRKIEQYLYEELASRNGSRNVSRI